MVKTIFSIIEDTILMSDGKNKYDLFLWLLILPGILEHSICTLR